MRLSTTRITALKRPLKRIRNLVRDPLPRNRELVFEGYALSLPEIVYTFSTGAKEYKSTARIELSIEDLSRLNEVEHHALFVNLGLALVTSHFLLSDFATVHVKCAQLNPRDIELLENHFLQTLTEFRYLAGLDPARRVEVVSSGSDPLRPVPFDEPKTRALMLNGGGKDTCVSAELLKGTGLPFAWLNCFHNATRLRVMEASNVKESYDVSFSVDKSIQKDAVYPWGIAPYMYAIHAASLIVAYLKNFKYLVSGAEHSADDPNLIFNGVEVNHQAGKTSHFERFFNKFVQCSVLEKAEAFSIARPFTDLRLGEMFSHFPQYFSAFFSCNVGMGTDKWCKSCHKCAFTYLALYPFFEPEELYEVFGEELFEAPIIRKYIVELATASIKPWECVGTLEESKLALYLSLKKSPYMEFGEWPRRKDLERACADIDEQAAYKNTMSTFLHPHNLPSSLEESIRAFSNRLLNESLERWPEVIPAARP